MPCRLFPAAALGLAAVLCAGGARAEDAAQSKPASGAKEASARKKLSGTERGKGAKPSAKDPPDEVLKRKLQAVKDRGAQPAKPEQAPAAVSGAPVDLPPEAAAAPGAGPTRPLSGSAVTEDDSRTAIEDADAQGEAFNRDLGSREEAARIPDGAGPTPDTIERVRARMPPGETLDPARPENPAALALAAEMGFRDSFLRNGLKSRLSPDGKPAILRRDGSPAAKSELAALRADILREPKALMRYPKLFSIVPRKDFAAVKKALAGGAPAAKPLQDMVLSPDRRDVLWKRSCSAVSGDCNPHAGRQSYTRSAYVRPRTLAAAAKAQAGSGDGAPLADSKDKLGRKLGAAKGRGIVARVKGLIGTLKRKFGFQDEGASSPSVSRSGATSASGPGAVFAGEAGAPGRAAKAAARAAAGRGFSDYRAPAAPRIDGTAAPAGTPRLRPGALGAGLLSLLLLLAALLRRRRED